MKILIIGATGMLGAPVVQHLYSSGHSLRIFSRNVEKARARFGPDYEYAAGDVDDTASLEAALQGCQGVHLSLDGKLDPDLERRGGENVAKTAAKAKLEMITYLSVGRICHRRKSLVCRDECQIPGRSRHPRQRHTVCHFQGHIFHGNPAALRSQGQRAFVFGRQPNPWHWLADDDFARMVAKAYSLPGIQKTFFALGPEALTMNAALQKYCDIVHPGMKVGSMPFWLIGLIASHPSRTELRAALPFFRYAEKVTEAGSPAEANALLGAPTITLEQWAKAKAN